MTGSISEADVAALAHVDAAFVARLVDLGVLRPSERGFLPGDVWRVRILRAVEASGVSLETVVDAMGSQDFDLSFLDTLLPPPPALSGRTFGDLEASLEDRGALAAPVAETLGLPHAPERPMAAADEEMLAALIRQWGADPDITLRAARLVVQTTQRFAEGWAHLHYELYRTTLGPDRLSWSPEEHAREAVAARSAVELSLQVLPWMVLHHVERRLVADVVDNVLTSAGPFAARIRDPEAGARLPAVAFVDISGYTALAEASGDDAAADVTSRFERAVAVATTASSGRVVKLLGDGALLLFANADPCVAAVRAVTSIRNELVAEGLHPHAGVDVGPVVERDGDIFGRTVNHASRLASLATAGQVVVSEAVASAIESHGTHQLEPLGEVTLKGVGAPVRAYLVSGPS